MSVPYAGLLAAALLTSATASKGAQTNAPQAPASKITVETIAGGLVHPWAVQVLPDGRYLVTERTGQLKVISADGKDRFDVGGVPKVASGRQGGLLDVALAPDFKTSATIFFSFSEQRAEGGNGTSVARAVLKLTDSDGSLEDVRVIFQQQPAVESEFHFGSRLAVAPDGTLFVTTGDRMILRDQAQNPANHLGKVIHITTDGTPAPNNPRLPGWDHKVWSIGHRNMQGAAVHPLTGQLWTVEHGARGGDELNHPEAGKNYGWPVITYGRNYTGEKIGEGTAKDGLEQPVYYWDPSIAVSGMTFYTGSMFPAWNDNILVGALNGAHVHRLVLDKGAVVAQERLLEDLQERIRDVRQAPDGSVLVLTDSQSGTLLRLKP